jgi:hypothetical protein
MFVEYAQRGMLSPPIAFLPFRFESLRGIGPLPDEFPFNDTRPIILCNDSPSHSPSLSTIFSLQGISMEHEP